MNKLTRIATVAAIVVAATAFATEASANPFAWLGYSPTDNGNQVRADLRRATVNYPTNEAPGTIIVDTQNTYLYLILGGGKDHTVPAATTRRNYRLQSKSAALTEYREYPDRSHYTVGLEGWEAVADHALEWAVAKAANRAVPH